MTKTMGKFKKLIPAICMLLISAVLMGTSTFAWFSMNKTVTATGMQVKARAEGSIVITGSDALPAEGLKATDKSFADTSAQALYASTHTTIDTTYTTGLKRVTNAELISPETGSALNSSSTLSYGVAENNTTSNTIYYKDYAVFIAGDGQEFTSQKLTISLTGSTTDKAINKAISIDFYGEAVDTKKDAAVSATNYIGTLNVAGVVNNETDNGTTAKTTIETGSITIPKTGSGKAYAVTLRVFYDGNLIEKAESSAKSYTVYKKATGTKPEADTPYYYLAENGVGVAAVASGADVSSYYIVNSAESTYRFARTTSVADISDVKLTVSFTASAA